MGCKTKQNRYDKGQNTLIKYSKNIPKILVIKLGILLLAHLASLQTTARLHGLHAIAFHNNNMPGLIINIFGIFLEYFTSVFCTLQSYFKVSKNIPKILVIKLGMLLL